MLRRAAPLLNRHTAVIPNYAKLTNRPGKWGAMGGPPADTFARRVEFYRLITLSRLGKLMQPFKTPRGIWLYRKAQARLFRMAVGCLAFLALFQGGTMWVLLAYNAYAVAPSTPVLQRKAREHRVSKQILTMVRERESEIFEAQSDADAAKIVASTKDAGTKKK